MRLVRLCLGVMLLLVAGLVAFVEVVTILGLLAPPVGLWFLLGIPLAVALLFWGAVLCLDLVEETDLGRFFGRACAVALAAMVVALIPAITAGPAIYQEHLGEQATAEVVSVFAVNGEGGGVLKWQYAVRDEATGEDLGLLAGAPAAETVDGDRIAVLVDPAGWVPPVAADQVGRNTVSAVVLAGCLAVVLLAALAVMIRALIWWCATGRRCRGSRNTAPES